MTEQLNLLGGLERPEDDALGLVQRAVMREVRRLGNLSWQEAGSLAHEHSGKHSRDEVCPWCGTDGANVCESLIRRGLVEPARHGFVRLPTPKQPAPPEARPDHDQWPAGF